LPTAGYISPLFDPKQLRSISRKAAMFLKKQEFDAIAVRGISGMTVGSIVSYLLDKPLIIVRKGKPVEPCHSSYTVESSIDSGTYIIIDDLISSENTIKTIVDEIKTVSSKLKPVGVYLWKEAYGHPTITTRTKLKVLNV
jgi:adenine/guanine phosphoribosyltransferase-like PRPP-binding protein